MWQIVSFALVCFPPLRHICFPFCFFFSAEQILETVQNLFWSNLMECLYWLCAFLTPSCFLLSSFAMFFFLLGGLWQYLLHYAQTCRRENHKLFFLTDVLISLIPFWLWPGRKPENSKSVSSKLCAGVEKSIRCLSMPRIWMGERERKRKRPPNSRAISCYGSRRNQIQLLWIAIFINNLCYFISGLSHNVFFWLMQWRGLKAGAWLNNENGLRGNEELRLSIREVWNNSCVSLLSISQVWNNRDAIDVTSARHLK